MRNLITATEARNKWFEILNLVYFRGEEIVIEKNKIPIVKLTAVGKPNVISASEVIKKTAGFLKNMKTYWPSEDKRVGKREIKYMDKLKSWI